MSLSRTLSRLVVAVTATGVLCALAVVPAAAHGGGVGVVPTLDPLDPALAPSVEVEVVRTQAASLLEISNPTDRVLEVLGRDGHPWLRIDGTGVEVASGAVDTYASTSPSGGAVPQDVLDGERENTWVRVSEASTWSWFEHRMHPEGMVPRAGGQAEQEGSVELLRWEVPLRYDGQDLALTGRLELRQATGSIAAELAGPEPDGVDVQVLSGPVPGILLTLAGADEVVVVGLSGEDYLRFGPDGVEVDVASPTHRAVEAARGNTLPPLEGPAKPDWQQVTGTPTHAWLETRARAPLDLPEDVRTGGTSVDLVDWEVPLRIDDTPVVVAGVTRWQPLTALDGIASSNAGAGPNWVLVVAGLALAGVALAVAVRRRRA